MTTNGTPGARFRTFRTQLGLSGQALAEPLGVTKTAVSYWESGRVSLSRTACLLAEQFYRISATWLLEGTGPMWLAAAVPTVPDAPDLVLRPLLPDGAFQEDGSVMPPRDTAPCLGLPRHLVDTILAACGGGTPDELFFFRVQGREMEPALAPEDWALLHTGTGARRSVVNHTLHLVRLGAQDAPQIRRLAVDPRSGDLLFGVDAPGHVPCRTTVPEESRPSVVLGRVCWIGGRR